MKNTLAILLITSTLVGCSAPASRPEQDAGEIANALFGAEEHALLMVPVTQRADGSSAPSLSGDAGLGSPTVAHIYRIVLPASSAPVRIAVSGEDSRAAANAVLSALELVRGSLPKLSLAFIGDQSHAAEIRSAVEAKGGLFLFAPAI